MTITVDDNDFIDLALGKANAPAVCLLDLFILLIINTFYILIAFC